MHQTQPLDKSVISLECYWSLVMSKGKAAAQPYDAEFKRSTVKLAVDGKQSYAQVARDLGVNRNTLYTWINQYHESSGQPQSKLNEQHLYDQLKELQQENKRLKEERDILKKAATYFAKHQS